MRYFSTFTGIGGLDMGLEEEGVECVGFSEIRESSIEMYLKHYPDHKNYGDITKINYSELPDFDLLTGGFPCQSFSIAGARAGFTDRRGQMIFHLHDLLIAKKPKYAVFENVKGISSHDEGRTIKSVIALLQAAGYFTRVLLLNSSNYGSAQARERVIFICRRDEDFPIMIPEAKDKDKRFKDFREYDRSKWRMASIAVVSRMEAIKGGKGFTLIGDYDRVNTLTTGPSTSGRSIVLIQEGENEWRYLTEGEGERLQGFSEGWTMGKRMDRWFAIGNAVNCEMSRYLFKDYLKKLWGW